MVALSSRIGECLALTWSDVYDNEDKHEPSYIRNYKELTYRTEKFIKETNGRGILKVFDQVRSTRPENSLAQYVRQAFSGRGSSRLAV